MMMIRASRSYIAEQESRQDELIEGLSLNGDSIAHHLVLKLGLCRESRERMRAWGGRPPDLKAVFGKDRRYRCEHHACWSCRRAKIHGVAKKDAARFWDADNQSCSHVTVADSTTGNLSEVRQRVVAIVRSLRDRRDAAAETRPLWAAVEIVGHVELDPYWADDIGHLAPDQHALILTLPRLAHVDDIVWVIRIHLAVRHDGISRYALQTEMSRQWPGADRVHLEAFYEYQSAQENAGRVISYSAKNRHQVNVGFITELWPISWQVSYWTWLHEMGRALQPLRVSVGPQRVESAAASISPKAPSYDAADEPMPMLFDWCHDDCPQDLTPVINWGREKSRFFLEHLMQAADRKRRAAGGEIGLDST
jgi:hypothetical protein